jgi:uncharacterized protein (DUF58 family)
MDISVYARLKKLQIVSKKISRSALVGDYASAFKGVGLEFDQLRAYVPGDDVRSIDWNASARTNETMIKTFIQERDRTVLVAIDTSSSMFYGSGESLKYDLACTIAGAIGSIAVNSHDKVGAMFFSKTVEKWIAPARGFGHLSRIVDDACQITKGTAGTSLDALFSFLMKQKNKRGVVLFVVSDWLDAKLTQLASFAAVARQFDLVAISITDPAEVALPVFGVVPLRDIESGNTVFFDTRTIKKRALCSLIAKKRTSFLKKMGVSHLNLEVGASWIAPLAQFFRDRTRRQV